MVGNVGKTVLKVFVTLLWLWTMGASAYFTVEVMDLIVLHLWNFTAPELFGMPEMHHYQGVALMILLNLFIGKPSFKACKKIEKELIKPLKKFFVEIDRFSIDIGEAKSIGKKPFFSAMDRTEGCVSKSEKIKNV